MFKRDNALLQGSWKQSCIVIGASIIWFWRTTNQPTYVNFRIWNRPMLWAELGFRKCENSTKWQNHILFPLQGCLVRTTWRLVGFQQFYFKNWMAYDCKAFYHIFWKQLFLVCLCRVLPYCSFYLWQNVWNRFCSLTF